MAERDGSAARLPLGSRAGFLACAAASVALLVFLYLRTRAYDPAPHERFSAALRTLVALESALDEDLLRVRQGLLPSFDPLVSDLDALERAASFAARSPPDLDPGDRAAIEGTLARAAEALQAKGEVVERYKSRLAIPRNSESYS